MLTLKHLAVVRAALKFMDEEISPHGKGTLDHYLDRKSNFLDISVDHIAEARSFFESVDLNYALVDAAGVIIESKQLLPAKADSPQTLRSDLSLIATVLLPSSQHPL